MHKRAKDIAKISVEQILGPTLVDKALAFVDGPVVAVWAAGLMLVAEVVFRWAAGIPLPGPGHYLFNDMLPAFAVSTLAFYIVTFWGLAPVVGVVYVVRRIGLKGKKGAGPITFLTAHLLAFMIVLLIARDLVFRIPAAFFDRFLSLFIVVSLAAFVGLGFSLTRLLYKTRYVFWTLTKPVWTRIPFYAGALFIIGSIPGLWSAREQPWLALLHGPDTNVVLITVGSTRADMLEPYGGPVDMPNLARFADEGILFEEAYSTAPWAGPALASVHTGRYPLRLRYNESNMGLSGCAPTVAETLLKKGYYTKAFVGGPECHTSYGFARGFASYVHCNRGAFLGFFYPTFIHDLIYRLPFYYDNSRDRGNARVAAAAANWLRGNNGRPFFLWVHLPGPELPYGLEPSCLPGEPENWRYEGNARLFVNGLPPDKKRSLRYELAAAYRRQLGDVDRALGDVLSALETAGLADSTLIIFVGVSGEALGEGGRFGHAREVYDENVRVPFVVRLPGRTRSSVIEDRTVSLVDIAPTAVKIATGEDLGSSGIVIAGGGALKTPTGPRYVYSETAGKPEKYARRGGEIFIYDMEKRTGELYYNEFAGGKKRLIRTDDSAESAERQLMNWREAQIKARSGNAPPSDTSWTTRLRGIGYLR